MEQLKAMTTDPKHPEAPLKRDADPLTGDGGDDSYDETAYALASRPWSNPVPKKRTEVERMRDEIATRTGMNPAGAEEVPRQDLDRPRFDPWTDTPSVTVLGNVERLEDVY
jgi:hypothetical protein